MRRSDNRILTTHVGSLPHLAPIDPARLDEAVAAIVQKQRALGIDIINEGEYSKGGDWLGYLEQRFGGFEEAPPPGGWPIMVQGKDRADFADFYAYAGEKGTLFYTPANQIASRRAYWVC